MFTKLHLNFASADWEDCMASKSPMNSARWRSKGLVTLRSKGLVTLRHFPVVCKYDQKSMQQMRANKKRLRLSELLVLLWMSTVEGWLLSRVPLLSMTSPRVVSWKAKFQHSHLWKRCRKESRYNAHIVLGTLPLSFPSRQCCTAFACMQFFTG